MTPSARTEGRAWAMLAVICAAQFLGMAPWFTASVLSEAWGQAWQLDATSEAALTSAVQLGFGIGTAAVAVFNLADLIPARVYVAASCAATAVVNLLLLQADGVGVAIVLRFFVGVFLAGVYPPAMKMAATWFRVGRGTAIGAVVGALILGKAGPWLARWAGWDEPAEVLGAASASGILAALIVGVAYRDGPFAFERPRFSFGLVATLVRHAPTRTAIGGYLGHMWELYAMWAWFGAFVLASLRAGNHAVGAVHAIAWAAIAAGAAGSVIGGRVADRWGRDRWVILCLVVSGTCCLLAGLLYGSGPTVLLVFGVVWGFFVVADSAQFSAMVTEVAPSHAVGTALTLQTSLGFLLTLFTIQWVPAIADGRGWPLAFPILALGPVVGILCVRAWTRAVRTPTSDSTAP